MSIGGDVYRAEQQFVCSDCKARAAAAGDCPCGQGPFLDLKDPAVREMLIEEDDRRAQRQTQRFLWLGVVVGVVAIVFSIWSDTLRKALVAISLPLPLVGVPLTFLGVGIVSAVVLSKVLSAAVKKPHRFPELRRR